MTKDEDEHLPIGLFWSQIVRVSKKEPFIMPLARPSTGIPPETKRNYNLAATRRRYTVVLLGYIDDAWLSNLDETAQSVVAPGRSSNPLDPFAVRTSQLADLVIFCIN
jgi:hypothetical protein